MRAVDEDLWEDERAVRILGVLTLPRRMTVVRLPGGGLWVHSPNRLDAATRAALDALGPVRAVVSPNLWHSLGVADFVAAYPDARFHAAPGLAAKRPNLRCDAVLADAPPPEWGGVLEQARLDGVAGFNEVVFLHRPSRTLVLTDLAFNVGPEAPRATRIFMRLNGAYDRLTPTRFFRSQIRDRAALRASLAPVLAWDFDRLLVAHGRIVEAGARDALREALATL